MDFIDIQRESPRGETDTSALQLSPDHPNALRVVGVIPHMYLIRFDDVNREKLRAWLSAQGAEQRPTDYALALLHSLDNATPKQIDELRERLAEIGGNLSHPAHFRALAKRLREGIDAPHPRFAKK